MILLDRQASVHLSSSSSGCTRYWQPPGWSRPVAAFAPEAKENLMPFDLSLISLTPDLRTLPGAQARIALSTRIVVVLTKLARDPRPELANRLGSDEAAARFLDLIAGMRPVWPEPVYVNPPCCPPLSYDEMMALDRLPAAVRSDRQSFADFVRYLLPPAAAETLF